jgi:hypothetical protein
VYPTEGVGRVRVRYAAYAARPGRLDTRGGCLSRSDRNVGVRRQGRRSARRHRGARSRSDERAPASAAASPAAAAATAAAAAAAATDPAAPASATAATASAGADPAAFAAASSIGDDAAAAVSSVSPCSDSAPAAGTDRRRRAGLIRQRSPVLAGRWTEVWAQRRIVVAGERRTEQKGRHDAGRAVGLAVLRAGTQDRCCPRRGGT